MESLVRPVLQHIPGLPAILMPVEPPRQRPSSERRSKTMGSKITKLQPFGGFCAETSGALTLVGATLYGIPVSTTHTITGAIVGVGSTSKFKSIRWGLAYRIVWAWLLTIPVENLGIGEELSELAQHGLHDAVVKIKLLGKNHRIPRVQHIRCREGKGV